MVLRSEEFDLNAPVCPVATLFSREEVARVLGVEPATLTKAVNLGKLGVQRRDNLNPTGTITYHNFFDILGYQVCEQLQIPLPEYRPWKEILDELLDFLASTFEVRDCAQSIYSTNEVFPALRAEVLEILSGSLNFRDRGSQMVETIVNEVTFAVRHEWAGLDARICALSGVRVQQFELFGQHDTGIG